MQISLMVKWCSLLYLYLYLFNQSHLITSWYPVSALQLFHEQASDLQIALTILFSLNFCHEDHKLFSYIFLQVVRLLKERNKRKKSVEVETWLFREPWPTDFKKYASSPIALSDWWGAELNRTDSISRVWTSHTHKRPRTRRRRMVGKKTQNEAEVSILILTSIWPR